MRARLHFNVMLRWFLPTLLLAGCLRTTSVGSPHAGHDGGSTSTATLAGRVCTTATDPGSFPVKILVLVDQSGSMCLTDPSGSNGSGFCQMFGDGGMPQRVLALESLSRNLPTAAQMSVVAFDSSARKVWPATGDFAAVDSSFAPALEALPQSLGKAADFQGALSLAVGIVGDDLDRVSKNEPELLQRTRYLVFMITDGIPTPRCSEDDTLAQYASPTDPSGVWADSATYCNDANAVDAGPVGDFVAGTDRNQNYQLSELVAQLLSYKKAFSVADVKFHYALLFNDAAAASCGAICDDVYGSFDGVSAGQQVQAAHTVARWLGNDLIGNGGGSFEEFENGAISELTFDGFDTRSLVSDNVLGTLFAVPLSATLGESGYVPDFDGDGLSDAAELAAGTNPFVADSDGDGFDDDFEVTHASDGFDPLLKDARGCDPTSVLTPGCVAIDNDGDGLSQFAEAYFGTLETLVDSDHDQILDGLEVRWGLDPTSPNLGDSDGDGVGDLTEVIQGTDPMKADNPSGFAFTISTHSRPGTGCYDFSVSGLPVEASAAELDRPAGFNLYRLWFAETPARAPLGSLFHAACVALKAGGSTVIDSAPIPETAFEPTYQLTPATYPSSCVGWLASGGGGP